MTVCERHGLVEQDGTCPACERPDIEVRPDYDVGGRLLRASLNDPMRTDTIVELYELLEGDGDVFVTADGDGEDLVNVVVHDDVVPKPIDNEGAARKRIAELSDRTRASD